MIINCKMTMNRDQEKAMFASMGSRNTRDSNPTFSQQKIKKPIIFARHPENLNTVQIKRLTTREVPEKQAVRELELFIPNDFQLYKGQFIPIVKNLERKKEKGTFDRDKARLAFLNLVNNGARKYTKEFGSGNNIFTKADKLKVASSLLEDYELESKLGNYKNI